jgi:polar amino acid transport system substrate-binding protein
MNHSKTSCRPRALAVTASISAMLLAAAGCSSSGSAASQPSPRPPAVQKDPELAAMVPESVRAKGSLDVASEIYPPAVIVSGQGTPPTGWDVETVRAVAATLGLQARFHIVPFDSIVPGLQAGRYQAAAGEIFITPERTKVVTFVQDHVSTDSLLVNTDNVITAGSERALCGRTLSVQVGSAEAALAASIASACRSAGQAAVVVQTLQEEAAVNLSVFDGRADAALGSTSQVAYVLSQAAKGVFKTVELPWSPKNAAGIALARNAGTDQLAKAIAAAIDKLIKDGTLQKILDIYNGGLGAVDKATIVPAPGS